MAKEHQRSNKEAKPKKEKPAAGPAPGAKGSPFPPATEPKKKR